MRRLLKTQDLMCTLNELITRKNPQIVSVYKDVMLYRFSKEKKNHQEVERMLFIPVRIKLAILNLILTLCAVIPFQTVARINIHPFIYTGCMILFIAFAISEVNILMRNVRLLEKAMPYVLIDELIARKIIVLVPKNAKNANKASIKAAK